MTYFEEFINSVGSLPSELKKNYTLMRELDRDFQEFQKQMEEQCKQELEVAKQSVGSGNVPQDASALRFSDTVAVVNKACVDIAEQKVALAKQTYDLVDNHIQRLDKYLKKFDEEMKRVGAERELTGVPSALDHRLDSSGQAGKEGEVTKSGRKRMQFVEQPLNMELDLPIDPNEPTYCYCNQVSFGEMVACDNPDCKIEWFHFDCVGIKDRPKGKWYCPDCAALVKRRKGK
eukprot:c22943_g1_i2 orf=316-1011(+)